MYFAKCHNRDVLNGCPQTQHGHLWDDEAQTHEVVLQPLLSTKKVAREVVQSFVECVLMPGKVESRRLIAKLVAEIDATDLPEEFPTVRQVRKTSHLKLVK